MFFGTKYNNISNGHRFTGDIIESKGGNLYFSITCTKFGLHNWYLDLLEARPDGLLLKYTPKSKVTSKFIDNLYFANGVTLSSLK